MFRGVLRIGMLVAIGVAIVASVTAQEPASRAQISVPDKDKVVFTGQDFSAILPAVSNGQFDVGVAAIGITDKRKATVDFSDGYLAGYLTVITTKDSGITDVNGLSGKRLGVVQGTLQEAYAGDESSLYTAYREMKENARPRASRRKVDAVVIPPATGVIAPTESEPKAATSAERTLSRCSAESISKGSLLTAAAYTTRGTCVAVFPGQLHSRDPPYPLMFFSTKHAPPALRMRLQRLSASGRVSAPKRT